MDVGSKQVDPAGTFRLMRFGDRLQLEKAGADGKRQYSFTLQARRSEEFAGMCRYQQTSPESSFTQQRICSRATPDGRITLADKKLIVTRNGRREEKMPATEQGPSAVLEAKFGIRL